MKNTEMKGGCLHRGLLLASLLGTLIIPFTAASFDYEFQINATTNALEARPRYSYEWGFVVYQFIFGIDASVATAFCRELGFDGSPPVSYKLGVFSSDTITAEYAVDCPSNMDTIESCTFAPQPYKTVHFDVIALICNVSAEIRLAEEVLEARANEEQPWGTVSLLGPGTAAVVCRTLGFKEVSPRIFSVYRTAKPCYEIDCPPGVSDFSACKLSVPGNCGNSIGLQCNVPWLFRLEPLPFTSGSTAGKLLVSSGPGHPYGAICPGVDPDVVCRSLGLQTPGFDFSYSDGRRSDFTVSCPSGAEYLDNCTFDQRSYCQSLYVLYCNLSLEVQLVDSTANGTAGQLQFRPVSDADWGTMCYDGTMALPACNTLGLNPSGAHLAVSGQNPVGFAYHFTAACSPDTQTLHECRLEYSEVCHADFTTLDCAPGWEARLDWNGGSGSEFGRLGARLHSSAPWGSVCYVDIGPDEALIACNTVTGGRSNSGFAFPLPPVDEPVSIGNLQCPFRAPSFRQCVTRVTPFDCRGSTVGLCCSAQPSIPWQFQLANTTNAGKRGVLQARPGPDAPWGLVRSHSNYFTSTEAAAACRSIGFEVQVADLFQAQVPAQLVYIGDIKCNDGERLLQDCSIEGERNMGGPFVGVDCGVSWEVRLSGGAPNRVLVRPNATAPWGEICTRPYSSFTSYEAAAACRSAEKSGSAISTTASCNEALPHYMYALTCPSTALSLNDCAHSIQAPLSYPSPALSVECSVTWQFRLDQENGTQGRFGLRPGSYARWGTMCYSPSILANEARAACHMLGFSGAGAGFFRYGTSSGYFYANGFDCPPDAQGIGDCRFSAGPTGSCVSGDLGLICNEKWEFRLADPTNDGTRGKLELRPNASSAWGALCASSLAPKEAVTACRSLGRDVPTAAIFQANASGSANGLFFMDGLSCSGLEVSLEACDYGTSFHSCSNSLGAAELDCHVSWEIRLNASITNATSAQGALELRPNPDSPWGVMCSADFDEKTLDPAAALAACESLGFAGPGAVFYSVPLRTHPFYLGGVHCGPTAQYIPQDCIACVRAPTSTTPATNVTGGPAPIALVVIAAVVAVSAALIAGILCLRRQRKLASPEMLDGLLSSEMGREAS